MGTGLRFVLAVGGLLCASLGLAGLVSPVSATWTALTVENLPAGIVFRTVAGNLIWMLPWLVLLGASAGLFRVALRPAAQSTSGSAAPLDTLDEQQR